MIRLINYKIINEIANQKNDLLQEFLRKQSKSKIKNKILLTYKDYGCKFFLQEAISAKNYKAIDLLLIYLKDLNFEFNNKVTPLILAVLSQDIVLVKKMLDQGADVNFPKRVDTEIYLNSFYYCMKYIEHEKVNEILSLLLKKAKITNDLYYILTKSIKLTLRYIELDSFNIVLDYLKKTYSHDERFYYQIFSDLLKDNNKKILTFLIDNYLDLSCEHYQIYQNILLKFPNMELNYYLQHLEKVKNLKDLKII